MSEFVLCPTDWYTACVKNLFAKNFISTLQYDPLYFLTKKLRYIFNLTFKAF